ncbi:MAG: formylglycine-generating enzyme family protein [Verrucomicrobiota bacterium]
MNPEAFTAVSHPEMVVIPSGSFLMGARDDDKFASKLELPLHEVAIPRAFEMGKYPVTFAQYDLYVDSLPHVKAPPDYETGRGDHPVGSVSWLDAQGYLEWLRTETGKPFRLPSESEWEYACRAGTNSTFSTGDDLSTDEANYWYSENGKRIGPGKPLPVGQYPPNAFGLFDMHGTICELVEDSWTDGYEGRTSDAAPLYVDDSTLVVARGGAWDYAARLLRAAFRDWVDRDRRFDNIGFRLACDLP